MEYQNASFCPKCGRKLSPNEKFCVGCGAENTINYVAPVFTPSFNIPEEEPTQVVPPQLDVQDDMATQVIPPLFENQEQMPPQNVAPQPQYGYNQAYNEPMQAPPYMGMPNNNIPPMPPQKKKSSKGLVIALIIVIVLALVGVLVALIATHTICISHEWEEATCTTPKTCIYCDKTEGGIAGHKWQDATCTTPKTCSVCKTEKGEPIGHIEGNWEISVESTLTEKGLEALLCANCGQKLDERSVPVKTATVDGRSFNFKDDEFVNWLESISTLEVGALNETDENGNNFYPLLGPDGEAGALVLAHDEDNGNVNCIMIYFQNDDTLAAASIGFIGEEIGTYFDAYNAAEYILYDLTYSKDSMTAMMLPIDDTMTCAVLCPTAILSEIQSA